jgi:hypothetical protein
MVEAILRLAARDGVHLTEDQIDRTLLEAERALGSYTAADGRVKFHISAHIVTAQKP